MIFDDYVIDAANNCVLSISFQTFYKQGEVDQSGDNYQPNLSFP